jgi:heptosyltransferase-2
MNDRILICGLNWLGDGVMSMPAIQALKVRSPGTDIRMLVKPSQKSLWAMHPSVASVETLDSGLTGALRSARKLRGGGPLRAAYIFPNSFRSALIPFLGLVPERVGLPGHQRVWMLTRVASLSEPARIGHQSLEYFDILGVDRRPGESMRPKLNLPAEALAAADALVGARDGGGPLVGLLPGAARGPSKRWPAESFGEVGRRLLAGGARVALFGTTAESDACSRVAEAAGTRCINRCGQTTLASLAACLSRCRVVVANDSGGMHLAAAVGARVVALYGLTDPSKTGPLGDGHTVLTARGVRGCRRIGRFSAESEAALRSISPDRVVQAVEERLAAPENPA